MSSIAAFTFNPFQENTYIIHDDSGECIIIDPGCYISEEEREISAFIQQKQLNPVALINTHCHIDHVLGNAFINEKFKLKPVMHKGEVAVLEAVKAYASSLGVSYEPGPEPEEFLKEGDTFSFGNTNFEILYTPGHSPASICLFNRKENYVVSGDVLFKGSIGRYDLPGGNLDILMKSINEKLLELDDKVEVYSGHGPSTTIGEERRTNPFLIAYAKGYSF